MADTVVVQVRDSVGAIGQATFTIPAAVAATTPTFTPAAGTYSGAQSVTLASNPGASIFFTTDGSTPTTSSTVYSGPITVSASETVKAIATVSGYLQSAVGSAAYTIGTGLPQAPLTAAFYTGGSFNHAGATIQSVMKHLDAYMFAFPEGRQQSNGYTAASFCQSAQAGALAPTGLELFSYFDWQILLTSETSAVAQANANMLLVNKYPSDLTRVTSNGGATFFGNLATVGTQPTLTSGTPPVTRNASQYSADHAYDLLIGGGTMGLLAAPTAPNPFCHVYADDYNSWLMAAGDELRNNTTQAGGQGSSPPASDPASQAHRNGWASTVARLKSYKPGLKVISDLAGFFIPNQVTTGMVGVLNGGVLEAITGWVNSFDSAGSVAGWVNMMQEAQRAQNFCAANSVIFFNHLNLTNDGRDFYRTTPYQAMLYGFSSAMQLNMYYCPTPSGLSGNMTLTNQKQVGGDNPDNASSGQFFDEYSVNPTTLIAYVYGDPNYGLGKGWAGTPINDGDPVLTIWANGIRRKRYQMANGRIAWFLVNPPGNGVQTVALGQRMQTLSGTQNPAVNTGNNNVTTVTMPDSSGRILVTFP